MRRILCYGDSNTWGYTPGTGGRYDEHTRWTGLLADMLGDGWQAVEEGLNGRTTIFPDMFEPFRNGRDMLMGVLASQKPLDVVIISLGTNDLKFVPAWQAARGAAQLAMLTRTLDDALELGSPKIIVISPIEVAKELADRPINDGLKYAYEESTKFPALYASACAGTGIRVIDAAALAKPSLIDCVHMTPEGHRALAEAVAQAVREEVGEC